MTRRQVATKETPVSRAKTTAASHQTVASHRRPVATPEERDTQDQLLVRELARLIDSKGNIVAAALFRVLDRAVWEDGVGDKRACRALRTALEEQ